MGKRLIYCKVDDEYLRGAGQLAGAVGSHDDVYLRIQFGGIWAGMSKYVTFKDALGEHPAKVWLLPSLLVEEQPEVYDVPIPRSAKAIRGNMMVTITGYTADTEGKKEESVTNTVTAYFKVLEADAADGEDSSVTLTLAQQVAAMMDRFNAAEQVRVTQETGRVAAEEAREEAETGREEAERARAAAEEAREVAEEARAEAEEKREEAERARMEAEAQRAAAEAERAEAEKRREDAGEGIVARAESMARWAEENAEHSAASADEAHCYAIHVKGDAALAAKEANRAQEEADRAARAGKSPYQVAVEEGYMGTEAEFYAALVSLKDGPFLPLTGGRTYGPVTFGSDMNDYVVFDPKAINPYTGQNGVYRFWHSVDFEKQVRLHESASIDRNLSVAGATKTPALQTDRITSASVDPTDPAKKVDIVIGNQLRLEQDIVTAPEHDVNIYGIQNISADQLTLANIIPLTSGTGTIGKYNRRFNSMHAKKLLGYEYVATQKLRPATDDDFIKFMCETDRPPKPSPNPLPVEWGGTGKNSLFDFAMGLSEDFGIPWFCVNSYIGTGLSRMFFHFPYTAKAVWIIGYKTLEEPTVMKNFGQPVIFVFDSGGSVISPPPEIVSDAVNIWEDDGMSLIIEMGNSASVLNRIRCTYYFVAFGEVLEV